MKKSVMKINEGATVVHVATPRVEQKILILAHYFVLYRSKYFYRWVNFKDLTKCRISPIVVYDGHVAYCQAFRICQFINALINNTPQILLKQKINNWYCWSKSLVILVNKDIKNNIILNYWHYNWPNKNYFICNSIVSKAVVAL